MQSKVVEEGSSNEEGSMQCAAEGGDSGGCIVSSTRANARSLGGPNFRGGPVTRSSAPPFFYAYTKQQQQQKLPEPQEGGATC